MHAKLGGPDQVAILRVFRRIITSRELRVAASKQSCCWSRTQTSIVGVKQHVVDRKPLLDGAQVGGADVRRVVVGEPVEGMRGQARTSKVSIGSLVTDVAVLHITNTRV